MSYAIAAGAVLMLAVIGMSCFALAQPTHWSLVVRRAGPDARTARALRITGVGVLIASLLLGLKVDGLGLGALLWGSDLAVAGAGVATVLAWVKSRARNSKVR